MPSTSHKIEVSQCACRHLGAACGLTNNIRLVHTGSAVLDSTNKSSNTCFTCCRRRQTNDSVVGQSLLNKYAKSIGDQVDTGIDSEVVVVHVFGKNGGPSNGDITISPGAVDRVIA